VNPKNLENQSAGVGITPRSAVLARDLLPTRRAPRRSASSHAQIFQACAEAAVLPRRLHERAIVRPGDMLREIAQLGTEASPPPALKAASAPNDVAPSKAVHVAGNNGGTLPDSVATFRGWAGECTNFPCRMGRRGSNVQHDAAERVDAAGCMACLARRKRRGRKKQQRSARARPARRGGSNRRPHRSNQQPNRGCSTRTRLTESNTAARS
jgi:hypothetical protein